MEKGYNGNGAGVPLSIAAWETVQKLWSTPRASDGEKGGPNMSFGAGGIPLPTQAVQTTKKLWLTPHGMNGVDHTGKIGNGGEFAKQASQVTKEIWATPQARDYRSGYVSKEIWDKNARPLSEQAVRFQCGLLGQPSLTSGELSSDTDQTSPLPSLQLNPAFVEYLLLGRDGIGWTMPTRLASQDSLVSVTA